MNASRRAFLGATAALSSRPLALPLACLGALAAHEARAASDYRALVCLFMAGGNDSHNWIVPTAGSEYATYAAARGDKDERTSIRDGIVQVMMLIAPFLRDAERVHLNTLTRAYLD